MATTTTTTTTKEPRTAAASPTTSTNASTVVVAGAVAFIVILAGLHVAKSDFDPSWRMISEYEIGRFGWLMSAAFLSLAVSAVATHRAIGRRLQGRSGQVGRAFFLVTAVGLVMGGVFISDPTNATKDQLTWHGNLHGIGFMLGVPGFLAAASLINRAVRRTPGWEQARTAISWATRALWASAVVFALSLAIMFDGSFGPDVKVGIPNRLLVLAMAAWMIVTGRTTAAIDINNQ